METFHFADPLTDRCIETQNVGEMLQPSVSRFLGSAAQLTSTRFFDLDTPVKLPQ